MTKLTALEVLAGRVALCAPLKRKTGTPCAYIPWDLIEEIRTEMVVRGIDWRDLHKLARELSHDYGKPRVT